MTNASLTTFVSNILAENKAQDIARYDVRAISSVTDFFVVATGTSNRHINNLADKLTVACKQANHPVRHVEGKEAGNWVLVDLNDTVVHIMLQESREFYQLDKLWGVATDKGVTGTKQG